MARPTKNVSSSEDDPEFFKVFMPSFSAENMWIPPAFVGNFTRNFPKKITLKDEAGRSWLVRVEKIEDKLCFTAGWEAFVRENSLERGDFLLFKLATKSSFEVKIYGRNGCKKDRSPKFGHQNSTGENSDSGSKESEDKPEIRVVKKNLKRETVPRPQNFSSGLYPEKVKEKEATVKFTAKRNRFFSMTLSAARASKYVVCIPRWAVSGIRIEEDIVLRCRNNQRVWPIGTQAKKDGRRNICSGWAQFVEENRVKAEDQCLFELVVDQTNTCREIIVDILRKDA